MNHRKRRATDFSARHSSWTVPLPNNQMGTRQGRGFHNATGKIRAAVPNKYSSVSEYSLGTVRFKPFSLLSNYLLRHRDFL
jgi:hypothetical protein